jgi:hypothetical protein
MSDGTNGPGNLCRFDSRHLHHTLDRWSRLADDGSCPHIRKTWPTVSGVEFYAVMESHCMQIQPDLVQVPRYEGFCKKPHGSRLILVARHDADSRVKHRNRWVSFRLESMRADRLVFPDGTLRGNTSILDDDERMQLVVNDYAKDRPLARRDSDLQPESVEVTRYPGRDFTRAVVNVKATVWKDKSRSANAGEAEANLHVAIPQAARGRSSRRLETPAGPTSPNDPIITGPDTGSVQSSPAGVSAPDDPPTNDDKLESNSPHDADSATRENMLLADLRKLIDDGEVALFIGTGVSVLATNGAPHATWTGLIESGIEWCVELDPALDAWAKRRRAELNAGEIQEILAAAQSVEDKLGGPGGGEFHRWLGETVGKLRASDSTVLEAIKDLNVPIITTNYDGLIEDETGLKPVTWRDTNKVEQVLRGDFPGVLHIHGYWDDPTSVVLGARSYADVTTNEHAQSVLRALRMTKSMVFIGYRGGLTDPNFSRLSAWTREVFSGSEYRHYRLAREAQLEKMKAQHDPRERIYVISYGKEYSDLPKFLRRLRR